MACKTCGKKKTKPVGAALPQHVTAAASVDVVRMEYLGTNTGAVPWRCPTGHAYAGSKKTARFANVFPEDVEFLERTRRWRRVQVVKPVTAKEIEEAKQEAIAAFREIEKENPIIEKMGIQEKVSEEDLKALAASESAEVSEAMEEAKKPKRRRTKAETIL